MRKKESEKCNGNGYEMIQIYKKLVSKVLPASAIKELSFEHYVLNHQKNMKKSELVSLAKS